ncbi:membrane-anchored junction protein isoform X1 [Girardinichthys multiradiatus]|uniref:membrane-anchored junction protein isoform X1 n=1 Tax=Girardinichthys multiradiatus TaxID=208333 RepID=UPI001FAB7691|nr:membrane-anchored junction protein isoform X1 [Girardinichthys multiradiatus]
MALHPFSFPVPETRYFKAGSLIYKFKIRRGNSFSEGEVLAQDSFDQEMEEIVRTVLGDLDCLQPFSTPHFTVFPYRRSWGKGGKHRGKKLLFYPFVIILYLEKNICQGKQQEKVIQLIPAASVEPRSKRRRRDSPLEEAIIKEILKATEAECSISVTGLRQHKAHQRNQGFSSSWSEKSSLSSSDLLKLRLRVDFYTGGCKLSIKSIVFVLVHHFQQFHL